MPIFKRNSASLSVQINRECHHNSDRDERRINRPGKKQKALILPTVEVMKQCFEQYLQIEVANGGAQSDTIITYQCRLNQFLAWCSSVGLSPAMIDTEKILIYRRYLIETRKLKSPTIALALVVIRAFYTACCQQGLVKENPVTGVNPPRAKVDAVDSITFLTLEQLQHLVSVMSNDNSLKSLRDRTLVSLMALEGLRTVELSRANLGNIRGKTGAKCSLVVEGKGKIRTVPLRYDLAELMWKYLEAREIAGEKLTAKSCLFISLSNRFSGRRLSRRGIRYIVDGYLKKAQLKEIDHDSSLSCHSLHHTAGTLGLAGGASLRQVQELLGHSDPKTTAIYAHVLERHENNPALGIDVKI
jgi:site-specific recombinase XerD